jgi:hypothetical protein
MEHEHRARSGWEGLAGHRNMIIALNCEAELGAPRKEKVLDYPNPRAGAN